MQQLDSQLMRLLAPAKINLHLRIGPLAADGFHPLMSWFCTVGLFDTLTIERGQGAVVSLSCDRHGVPCDATNLVVRAGALLAEEVAKSGSPSAVSAVKVALQKRIPMGGGLGGGSADAGRTLLGLNQFWALNWPRQRLSQLGAQLGSDVPFFLFGPSSICTGRGENVQPVSRPQPKCVVLILPGIHVSTPEVYRKFDEMKRGDVTAVKEQPDWRQWSVLSADHLLPRLINDLEAPAFALQPSLARLRADLEQTLSRPVRMSGSGSTLFTLYDEPFAAATAAARISREFDIQALSTSLCPPIEDDLEEAALAVEVSALSENPMVSR